MKAAGEDDDTREDERRTHVISRHLDRRARREVACLSTPEQREDTRCKEVVHMAHLMAGPAWVSRKLRRLRSLTKGEDTDPWYEERRAKREKPPNVGPNLGGGG